MGEGLAAPRQGRVVSWSPSVTLVPTRGCFNACGYCSFRLPPSEARPLALEASRARLQERQIGRAHV